MVGEMKPTDEVKFETFNINSDYNKTWYDLIEQFYTEVEMDPVMKEDYIADVVDAYKNGLVIVCKIKEVNIGVMVLCGGETSTFLYLDALYVVPEYRKNGIAHNMMDLAKKFCIASTKYNLIEVFPDADAISWYTREGFVQTGKKVKDKHLYIKII